MSLGVLSKTEGVLLGSAMLFGRLLDRLDRWNADVREKRRLLRSAGLSVVLEERPVDLSGVVTGAVDVLEIAWTSSGSSDTSRDEGTEESV